MWSSVYRVGWGWWGGKKESSTCVAGTGKEDGWMDVWVLVFGDEAIHAKTTLIH